MGNEAEVTQEPLTIVTQEKRAEVRTEAEIETEQLPDENRKRKRIKEEMEEEDKLMT